MLYVLRTSSVPSSRVRSRGGCVHSAQGGGRWPGGLQGAGKIATPDHCVSWLRPEGNTGSGRCATRDHLRGAATPTNAANCSRNVPARQVSARVRVPAGDNLRQSRVTKILSQMCRGASLSHADTLILWEFYYQSPRIGAGTMLALSTYEQGKRTENENGLLHAGTWMFARSRMRRAGSV